MIVVSNVVLFNDTVTCSPNVWGVETTQAHLILATSLQAILSGFERVLGRVCMSVDGFFVSSLIPGDTSGKAIVISDEVPL